MAFTIWFFKEVTWAAKNGARGCVGGVYGLALLSTALFAPRSLTLLGWAFLLTGIAIPVLSTCSTS